MNLPESEIEEAWAVEVERRIAEVESGAVRVIPMAEALARVRAGLRTPTRRPVDKSSGWF